MAVNGAEEAYEAALGLETTLEMGQEPDANELPARVAAVLPDSRVIRPPAQIKDLSDAHIRVGRKVPKLLRALKKHAIPARELIAKTLEKGATARHQILSEK